jgi:hypothetical protein
MPLRSQRPGPLGNLLYDSLLASGWNVPPAAPPLFLEAAPPSCIPVRDRDAAAITIRRAAP